MTKDKSHIPALIVILAICAFIAVLAMAMWPTDDELEITPATVIDRVNSNVSSTANTNTANTNSVSNANTNS